MASTCAQSRHNISICWQKLAKWAGTFNRHCNGGS
jgi:hypothetical protein